MGIRGVAVAMSMVLAMAGPWGVPTGRSQSLPDFPLHSEAWVAHYNGTANGDDLGRDVAVAPDGTKVFASGVSTELAGLEQVSALTLLAYDPGSGVPLWVARRTASPGHVVRDPMLAVAPDAGRVFVTVRLTEPDPGGGRAFQETLAYGASDGALVWSSRHEVATVGQFHNASLDVSPDGSLVFVGFQVPRSPTQADYGTLALDATTGEEVWADVHSGQGVQGRHFAAVAATPQGVVTGYRLLEGQGSVAVMHDRAGGERVWESPFGDASQNGYVQSVAAASDGSRVYVTGAFWLTAAYDGATGERLWRARHDATFLVEAPLYSALAPDGARLFVTGVTPGIYGDTDYLTVAYDAATGAEVWVARHSGGELDAPRAIGVAADGSRVFVTGNSRDVYTTIAYDAAVGLPRWIAQYRPLDTPLSWVGMPRGLAVHPDGSRVYVAGIVHNPVSGADFGTVAYCAVGSLPTLPCPD